MGGSMQRRQHRFRAPAQTRQDKHAAKYEYHKMYLYDGNRPQNKAVCAKDSLWLHEKGVFDTAGEAFPNFSPRKENYKEQLVGHTICVEARLRAPADTVWHHTRDAYWCRKFLAKGVAPAFAGPPPRVMH